MHGNKGFLQPCKKGAINIQNTPGYIQYADSQKLSPSYENVSDLTSFFFGYIFFRTLIPLILFLETLYGSPYTILGKKSQEFKTFLPKFLFPGFFTDTFFR